MPRKPKSDPQPATTDNAATIAPPQPSAMPIEEVPAVAKPRKRAAAKSTKTAGAKKTATTAAKKTKKAKPARRHASDEEIRLRAYFIAERRVQLGLPGNESDDWIEARRQLESEAGDSAS